MLSGMRLRLLTAVALLLVGAVPTVGGGTPAPVVVVPAECGPGDRPETGVPGQVPLADQLSGRSKLGYSCNLRPVGQTDIDGRGGDTQMTWYDRCAFRAVPGDGSDAVAVIDVANPRRPTTVRLLQEPAWAGKGGILGIHEGLHANAKRGLLLVPIGQTVTVYDIRDCRRPKLLSAFDFGYPPDPLKSRAELTFGTHSGKFSPDGTLYYATDSGNGGISLTGPCLTVLDLRDVRRPRLVTRWGDFTCHDLELDEDGRRAYVGYYGETVGHPFAVVGAFTPAVLPSAATTGLRIVDVSEVQRHVADPQLRILSQLTGGRQHTETYTRIRGRKYVIAGEEATCPGGNGRIVDVTDERHPVAVAEIPLGMNQPENCAVSRLDTENQLLLYMTHYISVDNPRDASLVFITWYSSGLRVFDIRDPRHPREVAYYNPPVGPEAEVTHDSSGTYVRYLPATGHVWFGSGVNGFTVVELDPRLRPATPGVRVSRRWSVAPATGRPVPTPAAARRVARPASAYVCTLRF